MSRCGYVSIVGRPNVGKSTLLNKLISQKLTITSDRPQTTRHQILGVLTEPALDAQLLFVDCPGYQTTGHKPLDRLLNRTALSSSYDSDLILFVCDARGLNLADKKILERLPKEAPVFLVINKTDYNKELLKKWAPQLEHIYDLFPFREIIPVSAKTGYNLRLLVELSVPILPESPHLFASDVLTDRSERFLSAERIREKLFQQLGDELPYDATVLIDSFKEILSKNSTLRVIHASILVKRDSQKAIVLGDRGSRIKKISTAARKDLEVLLGSKVFLEIFVKVVSGWADSEQQLNVYGYE